MKKTLSVVLIVIVLIIVAVILDHQDPYFDKLKELSTELKDFGGLITAIISLLNLFFLLSFRTIDSEKRRASELHDKKSYWFRDVILIRNLDSINKLETVVECLSEVAESKRNEKEMHSIINGFQKEKRNLANTLIDALKMIDEKICINLHADLDNFEDYFTEQLEEVFTCPEEDYLIIIDDLQRKFVSYKNELLATLFQFEMDGYVYKEDQSETSNENQKTPFKFDYWSNTNNNHTA